MAQPAAVALRGATGLLERAIGYTRASLLLVTPDQLANRTPCPGWDLSALLRHMSDGLAALQEAAELGEVPLRTCGLDDGSIEIVTTLRTRACSLLGAWSDAAVAGDVFVGDRALPTMLLATAGAIEITVHGWDVAWACGRAALPPASLADELLELAPLLVRADDRAGRFAAPHDVSLLAPPGERLLAFLGRRDPPVSSADPAGQHYPAV